MRKHKTLSVLVGVWALSPLLAMSQSQDLLFTGVVFSKQAQEVFVPLTNNWQARISMMLPEGSQVEVGDVVVEFDGSDVARQLEQQLESQRTEWAKTERDIAKLEKEMIEAEFQLKQSRVALELASMKADLPEGLIGGLEHSENMLLKERAVKSVEDAETQFADKRESATERRQQARLDQQKAENQSTLWNEMLASFTVTATQPGYVIYGKHPWNRTKFQEGDTVRTSFRVAKVSDTSDLAIKVWINSIDRPRIEAGTKVNIQLDALPTKKLEGRLESVSDSGVQRNEWGEALYYEALVLFESNEIPGLLPGMSALVEPTL